MKNFLTPAILALTVCATAFAHDGTVTRTFNVGAFDKLDASVFNIEVRIGEPTGKVEVTVSEKYADKVDVEVSGRTLNIGFDGTSVRNCIAKAIITVPTLREIEGESAAAISVNRPLRADRIEIDLSSAASFKAPSIIASQSVEFDLSSASSVNITKVETDRLECDLSSASKLDIGSLTAKKADIDVSSAASVNISGGTTDRVDLDASSSAKINTTALRAKEGNADASSGARISCNIANPKSISKSSGASVKNVR